MANAAFINQGGRRSLVGRADMIAPWQRPGCVDFVFPRTGVEHQG